jgi:hypothetical protein
MGPINIDRDQLKLKFAENPPANLFDPGTILLVVLCCFPALRCTTATISSSSLSLTKVVSRVGFPSPWPYPMEMCGHVFFLKTMCGHVFSR